MAIRLNYFQFKKVIFDKISPLIHTMIRYTLNFIQLALGSITAFTP